MRALLIGSILMAASGTPVALLAAPVTYDITFAATQGIAPAEGSFAYDSASQSFSNFEITWQGLVFDLTASANAPTIAGSVPCLNGLSGPAATFALLDGKCGTTSTNSRWGVLGVAPPGGPSETISLSHTASAGSYISFGASENVKFWIPAKNQGAFTVHIRTGIFHATGSMSTPREDQTATLLPSGKVLVAGGNNKSATLATAELYDAIDGTFSGTGSMITARFAHTATLLPNGKVLIAGGFDSTGRALASAELYDPVAGTFSGTGSMGTARVSHTATLLRDGKVLIAGGESDADPWLVSAELYDPETGTFSVTGSMTIGRTGHTATVLYDGRILIAGGININPPGVLMTADLYEPSKGIFVATGPMNVPRAGHTATLLHDGTVLVEGGVTNGGTYLATAELYDPKTNAFNDTGSMGSGRVLDTGTLLPDGKVLIAGGRTNGASGKVLASAVLYDPSTGIFSATGPMTTVRSGQAATILADPTTGKPIGKVLLVGGQNNSNYLRSAELFEGLNGAPD
jgi:hypothetical protein